jgi:hypothetical protein
MRGAVSSADMGGLHRQDVRPCPTVSRDDGRRRDDSKDFGNGTSVSWSGRLGFLAGVTPVIDRHHQVLSVLGQRFLMLRLPAEDRDTITMRALAMRGHETEIRTELREAMTAFLEGVDPTAGAQSGDVMGGIVAVSRYATQGRTGVERDGYSRAIVVVPELEVPTRFAKAVAALASALMAIGYTERDALEVVARVGRDSMPQVRVLMLQQLVDAEPTATPELSNATNLPVSTARLVAEDLTAIGLVGRTGAGSGLRWALTSDGVNTTKALAIGKDSPNTKGQERPIYPPPLSPSQSTFHVSERSA